VAIPEGQETVLDRGAEGPLARPLGVGVDPLLQPFETAQNDRLPVPLGVSWMIRSPIAPPRRRFRLTGAESSTGLQATRGTAAGFLLSGSPADQADPRWTGAGTGPTLAYGRTS
jgi:hypothetical protein